MVFLDTEKVFKFFYTVQTTTERALISLYLFRLLFVVPDFRELKKHMNTKFNGRNKKHKSDEQGSYYVFWHVEAAFLPIHSNTPALIPPKIIILKKTQEFQDIRKTPKGILKNQKPKKSCSQ